MLCYDICERVNSDRIISLVCAGSKNQNLSSMWLLLMNMLLQGAGELQKLLRLEQNLELAGDSALPHSDQIISERTRTFQETSKTQNLALLVETRAQTKQWEAE